LGFIVAASVLAVVAHPAQHPWLEVAAYIVLAGCGLAGAAALWSRTDRSALAIMLAVAALARIVFVFKAPFLSDDLYRYLWDGKMLLTGINPYVHAPDMIATASFHASWLYPHLYWHHWPSLYPPLDLALFALAYWIDGTGIIAIKSFVELGDAGALALLIVALRGRGLPVGRAALYAWSPLAILEFAWSGHEEVWCAAALIAAVLLYDRRKLSAAGAALAAAILTKLYPLAFVPLFFARRAWRAVAMCLGCVAVAYLPFYLWNHDILGFLHDFASRFQFNDTLYIALGENGAAALFATAVLAAFFARMRGVGLVETLVFVLLAYLLLAPTVWPWYLAGFVALLPLAPTAFEGAMRPLTFGILGWIAIAPLGYASEASTAAHVLEYVPVALGIAFSLRSLLATRAPALEPAR